MKRLSQKKKVLKKLMEERRVTNYALQSVKVGGVAGLRRLRELRRNGCLNIRTIRTIDPDTRKRSGTVYYELLTPNNFISFEKCHLIGIPFSLFDDNGN